MELPNETLKRAVHDIASQNGLANYKIEVFPGCEKGINFFGVVYKIAVNGFNKFNEKATLNLFCKTSLSGRKVRKNFPIRSCYLKEIKIYNEILKEMKKLEIEKCVKSGFTSFPKYLNGSTTEGEEFLIMEDLSSKNFIMLRKNSKFDVAHTQLVMKALAKFHALGFALKDNKPELYNKMKENLTEIYFMENDSIKQVQNNFLNSYAEKLDFDGIYKEKWEDLHKNYFNFAADCCNGQLAEPYAVICHGDVWNGNTMFKHENGAPIEVCLFDWQMSRYSSPVLDIVHYLFSSTDGPFRKLHYNTTIVNTTTLNIYYDSFSNFLKELGSSPESLFPFSIFQEQLKKYGKYGFIVGILNIPVIINDSESHTSLEEIKDSSAKLTDNQKTAVELKLRLTDAVKDLVDLGYL